MSSTASSRRKHSGWPSIPARTSMGRPKRNVLAAAEEALTPPSSLQPNQTLVRVVKPEGNNLYTCELPNKKPVVLELAQRFRNTIWIKRGGFVVAERYDAGAEDTRAAGEIVNIVRDEKLWRKQPYWPKEFTKNAYDLSDDEDDSNVGKMPPSDSEDE
ncbi:S1-like domain-containing protein [Tolypocladium paradoxum]|uniref:S1-like domain-containing protein n=1 Tax=Tolypocladium paradoxum TaxID=94208 RepID=A0A2S4KYS3_9HYPO|nr:S1-like domain-containing protein [Tolypocladium paradoxum]